MISLVSKLSHQSSGASLSKPCPWNSFHPRFCCKWPKMRNCLRISPACLLDPFCKEVRMVSLPKPHMWLLHRGWLNLWTAWTMNSLTQQILIRYSSIGVCSESWYSKEETNHQAKNSVKVAFNLECYRAWNLGLHKILVHFVVVV